MLPVETGLGTEAIEAITLLASNHFVWYRLVTCGHSLGSVAAALLAFQLKHDMPEGLSGTLDRRPAPDSMLACNVN